MVVKVQAQVCAALFLKSFKQKINVNFVGYGNWQMERSQDEVFMAGQEGGQHRDAQGRSI